MKKIYLLTILSFFIFNFSYAQWTPVNTGDYFLPSGNAGVGTSNMLGKFNVLQPSYLGSSPQNNVLLTSVSGLSGNFFQNNLWLVRNSSGTDWTTARLHDGISVDGSFLNPQVNTRTWWERDPVNDIQSWGTAGNAYLTINSGNLGIGTTNPSNYGPYSTLSLNNTSGGVINFMRNGNMMGQVWADGGGANLMASSGLGMYFYTDGNQKMEITPNGNVGIGTSNPGAVLDVGATLTSGSMGSVLARLPEGNETGSGTYLGIKGYDTQVSGSITNIANVKSFAIEHAFYGTTNSSINFFRGGSYTGGSISFNTNDNTEKMRILNNGNVGIGTSMPDQLLTVLGTIHARQVNIDLQVPGPDYVFAKNYKLKSLAEVNRYITLNKHLPEIPSAKTMEKTGVNVTELNMQLLKKVEELTLYMIEKDRQIDELKQQQAKDKQGERLKIEQLQKQVDALIKLSVKK